MEPYKKKRTEQTTYKNHTYVISFKTLPLCFSSFQTRLSPPPALLLLSSLPFLTNTHSIFASRLSLHQLYCLPSTPLLPIQIMSSS